MPDKMRLFVGSSSEQIQVAHSVADLLRSCNDPSGRKILDVHAWDEGIFSFSAAYIESLERELDRADFALIVMTGDDVAEIRDRAHNLPRDNVIFELGLFMGRLGRDRSFFLYDGDVETRIASDLTGVEKIQYFGQNADDHGGRPSLEAQLKKVFRQIIDMPARYKPSADVRAQQFRLWQFNNRISGAWWERMHKGDDDSSALSYVTIDVDQVSNTPKLYGRAYDLNGDACAAWESIASAVDLKSAKPTLHYRWSGENQHYHGQIYGGGGQIEFDAPGMVHGAGLFYDTNYALVTVANRKTTRIKNFDLFRCDPQDVRIMEEYWTAPARDLILSKLQALRGV